jgi:hypothetical protein
LISLILPPRFVTKAPVLRKPSTNSLASLSAPFEEKKYTISELSVARYIQIDSAADKYTTVNFGRPNGKSDLCSKSDLDTADRLKLVASIMEEIVSASDGPVLVTACGPTAMQKDVQATATSMVRPMEVLRGKKNRYIEIDIAEFGW